MEGREKERERNINVRVKHRSVVSCTCPLGTDPATQACALSGNWTSDLLLCGTMPNQLSCTGQCWEYVFFKIFPFPECLCAASVHTPLHDLLWNEWWQLLGSSGLLEMVTNTTNTIINVWVLSWGKESTASMYHTEGLWGLVLTFCPYMSPESYYQDSLGKDVILFISIACSLSCITGRGLKNHLVYSLLYLS